MFFIFVLFVILITFVVTKKVINKVKEVATSSKEVIDASRDLLLAKAEKGTNAFSNILAENAAKVVAKIDVDKTVKNIEKAQEVTNKAKGEARAMARAFRARIAERLDPGDPEITKF